MIIQGGVDFHLHQSDKMLQSLISIAALCGIVHPLRIEGQWVESIGASLQISISILLGRFGFPQPFIGILKGKPKDSGQPTQIQPRSAKVYLI